MSGPDQAGNKVTAEVDQRFWLGSEDYDVGHGEGPLFLNQVMHGCGGRDIFLSLASSQTRLKRIK
jgi:hypothetical protein